MNASRFDQIVKNRAQQRVEARIEKFRAKMAEAFRELGRGFEPQHRHGFHPYNIPDHVQTVLSNIQVGGYLHTEKDATGNYLPVRWPKLLWETEEKAIEEELLKTMDEMQKALVAPSPGNSDTQPAS